MAEVYPLGRNKTYYIAAGLAGLALLGFIGYKAWSYERNQRLLKEAENAQLRIGFKQLSDSMVQLESRVVKSQDDLRTGLSKEYQDKLKEEKQTILGNLQAVVVAAMAKEREGKGLWLSQTEIQFPNPNQRGDERLLDYFIANLQDPKSPTYRYKILPQTINISGTLNWDEQNGNAPFWLDSQTKTTEGGLQLSIPKASFTVGPEFTRWVAEMRSKKEVKIPVMPKYTVDLMLGKEFSPLTGQTPRTVFGAQGAYHTVSGFGFGGGALTGGNGGTIVFGKIGYSFGIR